MSDEDKVRLERLLRHIDRVRDNCLLLGERLIDAGRERLGLALIANGHVHDVSKFKGAEWVALNPDVRSRDPGAFEAAHLQHVSTNPHHPEFWGGVDDMPPEYVAEMVCDWKARSDEMGDDIWEWVREKASVRYEYSTSGRVYKEIKHYLELLLEPKFK